MLLMLAGILAGVLVYALTVFPLAYFFGFGGDTWAGVCMLWGVTCGIVGAAWAIRRGA